MKKELLKKLSLKLKSNKENWMDCFRNNVQMYVDEKEIRMSDIANEADISVKTLDNFLHNKTKDCNLSTAVALARALEVSLDELVGAETIEEETRKVIAMARNLKEHHRKVIRMYAKHQYELHGQNDINSKSISILTPVCKNGHLKTTILNKKLCIDFLEKPTREKVGMGIKIPCDHYEPHFLKDEVVLLGFDREGENNEMCVISYSGNLYFCIKKIQFVNGKKEVNYVAITNKQKIFSFDEIDDRFGYVVGWLEPDGEDEENTTYSWGER